MMFKLQLIEEVRICESWVRDLFLSWVSRWLKAIKGVLKVHRTLVGVICKRGQRARSVGAVAHREQTLQRILRPGYRRIHRLSFSRQTDLSWHWFPIFYFLLLFSIYFHKINELLCTYLGYIVFKTRTNRSPSQLNQLSVQISQIGRVERITGSCLTFNYHKFNTLSYVSVNAPWCLYSIFNCASFNITVLCSILLV